MYQAEREYHVWSFSSWYSCCKLITYCAV